MVTEWTHTRTFLLLIPLALAAYLVALATHRFEGSALLRTTVFAYLGANLAGIVYKPSREVFQAPTAKLLVAAFFGANLVALLFLTWSPTFLGEKFSLGLAAAGLTGTFFIQVGSMFGALTGGVVADAWRRRSPGGRILTQAVGASLGAPFIFLYGYTKSLPVSPRGDEPVRHPEGHLRCQHLGLALRRRPTGAPRLCGRPYEHVRMARRRIGRILPRRPCRAQGDDDERRILVRCRDLCDRDGSADRRRDGLRKQGCSGSRTCLKE